MSNVGERHSWRTNFVFVCLLPQQNVKLGIFVVVVQWWWKNIEKTIKYTCKVVDLLIKLFSNFLTTGKKITSGQRTIDRPLRTLCLKSLIAGGDYFFFRTKRGLLFEGGDYFRYCLMEVVPLSRAIIRGGD